MGTGWSAKVVDAPDGLNQAIKATLQAVIDQMSHWEPTSQLSRFNAATPGGWHRIAPQFAQVMATALDITDRSSGAFDPAMGTLVDLWGFGPPGPRTGIPIESEIAEAHFASRHDAIEFDPLLLRVRRTRPARLDLSGIAKGHAVDAVAATLRAQGCTDFLVEIGGELTGSGIQPDGQPWWVDVEPPPGLAIAPLRMALHGLSVATSGDYRRAFEADGAHHPHTIDPRTGHTIANGVASVTVLHKSCMHADAWASALTVLGAEAGMALADREALAVHMVARTADGGREWLSHGLRGLLE